MTELIETRLASITASHAAFVKKNIRLAKDLRDAKAELAILFAFLMEFAETDPVYADGEYPACCPYCEYPTIPADKDKSPWHSPRHYHENNCLWYRVMQFIKESKEDEHG